MQNIYLKSVHSYPHQLKNISNLSYQPASNALLLIHDQQITKYSYESGQLQLKHAKTWGPFDELQNKVLLLEDMVQQESVLVVTQDGSIFTVDGEGEVDIKAQNQDGIVAATVSSTQEYIYLLTKNRSLIQLNHEYDLVNEIPVDQDEQMVIGDASFSWRTDGNYFIVNYQTPQGHKAVTKDLMMSTFISPAKSDPNQDGLVQSVSQKGRKNMSGIVAWQPSGSSVAGVDYIMEGQNKRYRVIFWEKNGLRHLEFKLPQNVVAVDQLLWSADSTILYVKVRKSNNLYQVLVYFRANYHWYIKNVVSVTSTDLIQPLNSKSFHHQLLIVSGESLEILQYETRLPEKQWKSQTAEIQFKSDFVYVIDGRFINITDLSKCLMPPPMSMFSAQFKDDVLAASKKRHNLLVLTKNEVLLYDFVKKSVVSQCQIGVLNGVKAAGVRLLQTDAINFVANGSHYQLKDGQLNCQGKLELPLDSYKLTTSQGNFDIQAQLTNNQLTLNGNTITHECSSFIFYHQFLLFTVSTSQMYDKLFAINLPLSSWIYEDQGKVKSKLAEIQQKQMLNHRLMERGAKIVAVNQGRVVFQMSRGNLEGIYPKVIMIDQVQKHISNKNYSLAFQAIRTHKLDFNLLTDIDPELFQNDIQNVLKDIKRVDYINLLISQISETISSELQYIIPSKTYDSILGQFEMVRKGKKVPSICRLISTTLRDINKEDYILSIFTAEIRQGRVSDVLFEIKQLKKQQVQVVVPPHIVNDQQKKKKKQSAQQILEFVCWLVDPNAIYEAALLTYDLQLAAITARCTQKDPKQYIPYFQSLRQIKDQVDFRTTICLDLKKYDIAVKQLSQGNLQQRNQSLDLIKKHKLYKQGLRIYSDRQQIINVKEFIIEELLSTGEVNEAYRVCQSVGLHQRCLDIAVGAMDAKKIKETLQILHPSQEERKKHAKDIVEQIKDEVKNKFQLAKLYIYLEQYEQAVTLYLRHNYYAKAYKHIWKVSEQFRQKQMKQGFKLCFSIKKNEIIKDRKDYLEKYNRLRKVHKSKEDSGIPTTSFRNKDNDDMYSEVSVTSKAASSYTMSTTTGMRKKKDKKRSILTRNVKQGSPLEEQYLLAYLKMLEDKVEDAVKDAKLLIQHLIYMNLIDEAELLRDEVREYIEVFSTYQGKSFARIKFQETHPEAVELYFQTRKVSALKVDAFNYLF